MRSATFRRRSAVACLSAAFLACMFSLVPASAAEAPAGAHAGADWTRYGGGWAETHFSPLDQINAQNINRLGLVWHSDLPNVSSAGVTAPLAIDGVLYYAVGLNIIQAQDALTGKLLWQFDSQAASTAGQELRAAWGVRGIAADAEFIFTGTADGRLLAIHRLTGKLAWSAQTTARGDGRSITGPPYVMDGKVVIGNGGGDFAPVRGYVTAYDTRTGAQVWRFYTVPGNPADGFENEAMRRAAQTWTGEWWRFGGGGTAWHAMAWDPEQRILIIGTGNGAPWNQHIRSPLGGDNLYLCALVALDADTGEYRWHYQINPGESWDYNAAMDIEFADLNIDGRNRKVLLHAPKNGFFYVIDRITGELISAEPFATVNWARGINPETGRPDEVPAARYPDGTAWLLFPAMWGAHGVEAMSYNPVTRLAYIPARDKAAVYTDPDEPGRWTHAPNMAINSGIGTPPADPPDELKAPPAKAWLSAWDPVAQKEVWRVEQEHTHNGGTLTTAGNLVLQGRATGRFDAYAADSGKPLWSFDAGNGIMGQPISYTVDGRQFITVLTGWRFSTADDTGIHWDFRSQQRRVLTFALDAKATLPRRGVSLQQSSLEPSIFQPVMDDPQFVVDADKSSQGKVIFHRGCHVCHGGSLNAGGAAPDLRRSAIAMDAAALTEVVVRGALKAKGMPDYPELSADDVLALQHYIRDVARRVRPAPLQQGHLQQGHTP